MQALCGSHLLKQPNAFDGLVAQFAADDQLLRAPRRTAAKIDAFLDGKGSLAAKTPSFTIRKLQNHRAAALRERQAHIGMHMKANGKRQPPHAAILIPDLCFRGNHTVDAGQFETSRTERHAALMNDSEAREITVMVGVDGEALWVFAAPRFNSGGSADEKRPEKICQHSVSQDCSRGGVV